MQVLAHLISVKHRQPYGAILTGMHTQLSCCVQRAALTCLHAPRDKTSLLDFNLFALSAPFASHTSREELSEAAPH